MPAVPNSIRRILLAAVPDGKPKSSDFRLETAPGPTCPPDGLLVRTLWISVDPYLRGRITGKKTYVDPIPVGDVMASGAVGQVVESCSSRFAVGDIVSGLWGWQDYAAVPIKGLLQLDRSQAPVSTALGILGMPGMTAYFGFLEICDPKPGETVVVSGAAGAVGSAVGQIAKIKGCRVIGVAGSPEKLDFIRSLGFDDGFNYRTGKPYADVLRRLCPNGIDCYFDNVGGEVTDAVIAQMNVRGRISLCGQISAYNDRTQDMGPRPFWQMVVRQIKAEGFIVSRWADRFKEGRQQMAEWLREGKLQYRETVYEGLENVPQAFIGLFEGENTGKAVVRLV
jgi:NADPH:quinone reductase